MRCWRGCDEGEKGRNREGEGDKGSNSGGALHGEKYCDRDKRRK